VGYQTAKGRYANTVAVTLAAAGTVVSATGPLANSVLELGDRSDLRLDLNATVAGTTMTVAVETSPDGNTWSSVASFAPKTATGNTHALFGPVDRFVRLNVTAITGSFTFGCTGEAV
jgi:hypothetical protein